MEAVALAGRIVESVKKVKEVKEVKSVKTVSPSFADYGAGRLTVHHLVTHRFSPLKENPKYEFRNPKQYQMFETEITKTQSQCTSTVMPVSIIRLSVI